MAILEPVSNAGLARELEEVVAVSSHDGVVLLDDDPGIGAAGGDVLDEAARAETMIRRRRACSCFMWIRR